MNTGTFIALYLPIFIVLFIIFPEERKRKAKIRKRKKVKGEKIMSNELITSCIGKTCTISTGSMGTSYSRVVILEVADNWIKVQGKGKTNIVNVDFIENIKIHGE